MWWRGLNAPLPINLQRRAIDDMKLTAQKPTIHTEALTPVTFAMTKLRHRPERHSAEVPDIFPTVLDDVVPVKARDEAVIDLGDAFDDAPPVADTVLVEEITPVQHEIVQCLQNLLPVIPAPLIADVPVEKPHMETASAALSHLIAKISVGEPEPVVEKKTSIKADVLRGNDKKQVVRVDTPPDVVSLPVESVPAISHSPDQTPTGPVDHPQVEVRIMKVETSFSPTAPTSLVTQFSKVMTDMLEAKPGAVVHVAALDPRPDIVRSLELQLHPDDLGKIKVAMRLRGTELSLKIEVTSHHVEQLLLRDHAMLKEIMGHAGYDIADAAISVSVTVADVGPRSMPQPNLSQDSFAGQNGRAFTGNQEQSRNPFHNTRGFHGTEFDRDGEIPSQPDADRGAGVYL
jgi:Flagellar hook-length control protein FliK